MLKLQFLTGKKYSEAWSVVNHCIFSKAHWFNCISAVLPLYVFAVYTRLLHSRIELVNESQLGEV
jgi:hypothetical protein